MIALQSKRIKIFIFIKSINLDCVMCGYIGSISNSKINIDSYRLSNQELVCRVLTKHLSYFQIHQKYSNLIIVI